VAALRERLARAGTRFAIQTFAGCGHAFFNDTRADAYRPAASAAAFAQVLAFLRTHLEAA
jgi:dienelactone hydrolase